MANGASPAIARSFNDRDDQSEIISRPYDTVSFTPGLGDVGYRFEVVEHYCPHCDFDRMVRRVDVNPEYGTEVRYWCLNPNCPHFLPSVYDYAFRGRKHGGQEPVIFE